MTAAKTTAPASEPKRTKVSFVIDADDLEDIRTYMHETYRSHEQRTLHAWIPWALKQYVQMGKTMKGKR